MQATAPFHRLTGAGFGLPASPGPDALDQAVWTRRRDGHDGVDGLAHHSDRGTQYTSIALSERLAETGIAASVRAVGSSYDNALAETINGLYTTELIKPRKPWRRLDDVEFATAEWVDWYNHRRLYRYRGDMPPPTSKPSTTIHNQQPCKPQSSQRSESPDTPGRFIHYLTHLLTREPWPLTRDFHHPAHT